ncbi:MAG: PP2C family protein-serine/threonine phosphatase, partial [Acidimicrobiia bacterium]
MARSSHTFGLRHRLASAAATFVTLLMVGAVLSIVMINGWSSALERRRTSRAALVEINALQTGYGEQGSGVQGFVLTADRRYLDTFDEGIRRVGSAYQSLSRMTMPGERFDRSIETLRAAGDEWLIAALRPLVASTQAGELPSSEVIEAGRLRYEVLRHQLDSTRSQLDAAVQHAESRSHRFEQLAVTALLFAFGSGLVFAVVILVLIRRWMLDPLRELTIATVAVAHGEPTAIPRPLAEELSIVADAVDFLQRSKSEERDNALRAMQGLEQTAILALRVRSELANEIGTPPPGWDAHCSLRSAEGVVAGDCIDTGLLDSSTMFVVVLDVTGHGATAALHALRAKSLARMGLKSGLQPGEAIELVSRQQRADEHSQYLTAFVALVDLVNGVCRYANAGHPPA